MLFLSRKQVTQPGQVNLNEIVAEVEKMLTRVIGEDIRMENVLDSNLGYVMADPAQLHQILMNLAINARDAMPEGGALLIETVNVDLTESFTREHADVQPGSYVQLTISDTGTGMSPEVMSHLFEPFFTTKGPGRGTGLGLATVYGVVKRCGGSIWVYSEPGQGTSFRIYLPRIQPAEVLHEEPKPAIPTLRGEETILVVEDQEQLLKMAVRVLQSYGYKVLEAASPVDALAYSERYAGPIHLLLTDIVMPAMSGHELAERLSNRCVRP